MVLAAAQRARLFAVNGPRDNAPCVRQTSFPFMAGALHCCLVRFDVALHCLVQTRPPSVRNILSGGVESVGLVIARRSS